MPRGFFGTRADALMDVAIVVFTALPLLVLTAIAFARRRRHVAHRNLQTGALLAVLGLLILFEIDIRLSGGTAAFLGTSSVDPELVRGVLRFHVCIAVLIAGVWIALAVRSWRRFRRSLPGPFSAPHRRWGWLTLSGVVALSSTGVWLYLVLFVL